MQSVRPIGPSVIRPVPRTTRAIWLTWHLGQLATRVQGVHCRICGCGSSAGRTACGGAVCDSRIGSAGVLRLLSLGAFHAAAAAARRPG